MNIAFFAYEMPRTKSADAIGSFLLSRSAPVNI